MSWALALAAASRFVINSKCNTRPKPTTMDQKQITGRLISRNWIINLIGQGLPLLIGVVTIPWLSRYLGMERFGILSIAWTLLIMRGNWIWGWAVLPPNMGPNAWAVARPRSSRVCFGPRS